MAVGMMKKMAESMKKAPKMKLQAGDLVQVITGKDKGKQGKILKVYPIKSKVIVEGVNIVKRHRKPTQLQPQGGIESKSLPLHVCKVMAVDASTQKPSRLGVRVAKDGSKERIFKKSGNVFAKPLVNLTAK